MKSYDDINRLAAECLYTGMMTDTGTFSYNSNRTDINHNGLGCYVCESLNDSLGIDRLYGANGKSVFRVLAPAVQMANCFFRCLHRRCKCQIGFSVLAQLGQMIKQTFWRLPNLGK